MCPDCDFVSDCVFSHHQQSLVGIDDAKPNGHVGVLTVLQEGTDGDVPALWVWLLATRKNKERELSSQMHVALGGKRG